MILKTSKHHVGPKALLAASLCLTLSCSKDESEKNAIRSGSSLSIRNELTIDQTREKITEVVELLNTIETNVDLPKSEIDLQLSGENLPERKWEDTNSFTLYDQYKNEKLFNGLEFAGVKENEENCGIVIDHQKSSVDTNELARGFIIESMKWAELSDKEAPKHRKGLRLENGSEGKPFSVSQTRSLNSIISDKKVEIAGNEEQVQISSYVKTRNEISGTVKIVTYFMNMDLESSEVKLKLKNYESKVQNKFVVETENLLSTTWKKANDEEFSKVSTFKNSRIQSNCKTSEDCSTQETQKISLNGKLKPGLLNVKFAKQTKNKREEAEFLLVSVKVPDNEDVFECKVVHANTIK